MSTPEANFTWPVGSPLDAEAQFARRAATVPIATELDAVSPMRIIELGLLRSGEIPVVDDVEIRRTSSTTAHHSRLK
jgi:hypothetical protein